MGCNSGLGVVAALLLRGIRSHFSLTAAKRGLLMIGLGFMGTAGSVLAASSTVEAAPPPCVPGNLDMYIALGSSGCAVGDVTFFNFAYTNNADGTGILVPSSSVSVAPPTPGNPGLRFAGPFAGSGAASGVGAGNQNISEGKIFFDINTPPGVWINQASLDVGQAGTGV